MRNIRLKQRAVFVAIIVAITLIIGFSIVNASDTYAKPSMGGISIEVKQPKVKKITLTKNNKARVPSNAPKRIKNIIRAANRISHTPYKWGGGHGRWKDSGYDCSGSVSYALRGGNLLSAPRTSGGLASWGKSGKGKWLTVYANSGHTFMVFKGGIKFDTSGANPSRWQKSRGTKLSGYTVRHPKGL